MDVISGRMWEKEEGIPGASREEKEGVMDDDLDEAGSAMPASGLPWRHGSDKHLKAH